jgi:hypothetical protein
MARRRRADDDRGMDSLMDALTNVVGILLLILIVSSLGISAAVKKVVENLPEVTEEELEAMKVSRDKTLKNLQELQITKQNTEDNLPTEEEKAVITAEIDEIEKNNKDLADKTADIEEWKRKVDEEEEKKIENDENVKVADLRNQELSAILAQTPKVEVKVAKEVLMPNPRLADDNARALYIVLKSNKLYFVGDPYEHALKIRDVIDQNFSDLAYNGKALGSYTYSLKGMKKTDWGSYAALTEDFNLTRTAEKELTAWSGINTKFMTQAGEMQDDRSVLKRMFGNDNRKEFQVHKFRFDMKKLTTFFGDGKFGPKDFKYFISKGGGDKVKFSLGPREEGGWTPEQFLAPGSEFETFCKSAAINRGTLFYYYVAPDSFDAYLQARAKSESFRIPAGWTIWAGEKFEPKAIPARETIRYDLETLPASEYRKLADLAGPFLVAEVNKLTSNFENQLIESVPEDLPEGQKADFLKRLREERLEFITRSAQVYAIAPFNTALAVSKVRGDEEVRLEIRPPEIPHIRVFQPANLPAAPKPKPDPNKKPPPTKKTSTGGDQLILD